MFKDDPTLLFNHICSQFSNLMYVRSKDNKDSINKLLEEVNNLEYHYPVFNTTKAVLLVHQCCSLISTEDSNLVSKFCHLLKNLVNRQHLQIEGQTLKLVTTWCTQALRGSNEPVVCDVLLALEALLSIYGETSDVLGVLISAFDQINSQRSRLLCIQCLVLCTIHKDQLQQSHQLSQCAQIFVNCLKMRRDDFHDILYFKLLTACLRGLHNIIIQNQEFLNQEIGTLLGICRSYNTFGIKGIDFLSVDKIVPSVLNIPETEIIPHKVKGAGQVIKKRRVRTSQNKKDGKLSMNLVQPESGENVITSSNFLQSSDDEPSTTAAVFLTSESDFSDSENGKLIRLDVAQSRIRQASLDMLLYIVKNCSKNTIFTYWSSLIPDSMVTSGTHHLTSCILRDPSPKGRMAALKVLLALLTNCRLYLGMAETSDKQIPFTPFSVILGSMLMELHKCLNLALHENFNTVLIQVLKCLAALVQATPYQKLPAGIITKIMRNIKVYITHKDATVQVAALIVLGYIVGSEHIVPELKTALLKNLKDIKTLKKNYELDMVNIYDYDSDYDDDDSTKELPWLLERCLFNLCTEGSEVAAPIKVESLHVITAMSKNCFEYALVPHLTLITKAFETCLSDSYCDLRLHTGRTIDFMGQTITQNLNVTDPARPLSVGQGLLFWQPLLNGPLIELADSYSEWVLRAVACDCLGSIGPHIYEHLPKNQQLLVITLLVGCSRDEQVNVRTAAVRALAISVVYPLLREDLGFVADVAEAICRTLQEDNVVVRMKSSWSLGNLSDALVLNKTDGIEDIPEQLLLQLLQLSIKSCSDKVRVQINAVRALGNLLQIITEALMSQKIFKDIVEQSVNALVNLLKSGIDMKLKWNCCYATGSIFKNPILLTSDLCKTLFDVLTGIVKNSSNFKVRINSAFALSCPSNRETYGQYFIIVWVSLLTALENTQNVEDFNEYNHRDNLVEQICLTLAHMASLLQVEDVLVIKEKTMLHIELLQQKMHRTVELLIPEKSSVLLAAVAHLNSLIDLTSISEDHIEIVTVLLKVFTNPFL